MFTEELKRLNINKEKVLLSLAEIRGGHRITDENPEEKFNALQKYIQDPLSLKLLDGSLKEGAKVIVDLDVNKKIVFR